MKYCKKITTRIFQIEYCQTKAVKKQNLASVFYIFCLTVKRGMMDNSVQIVKTSAVLHV